MHKVSVKRQITLPKALCDKASIAAGDYIEIFEHNGKLTVVKQTTGISAGSLKHLQPKHAISDKESLLDALNDRA